MYSIIYIQPYIVAGNILCVWAFNKKDVELKPSFANLLKFFSSSISTFIEINIIIIVIIIQMTFILNFYLLEIIINIIIIQMIVI